MAATLVLHLCIVLSNGESPPCTPTRIETTAEECEKRAKYYNTEFRIPRTFKGDKAENEMALVKPARCEVQKP